MRVRRRDARDTYLPAFRACASKAAGVMCSYNAVNGTPACASSMLLQDVLRGQVGGALPCFACCKLNASHGSPPSLSAAADLQFNFSGLVVSDCGALNAITDQHGATQSYAAGAAAALLAGTDLACTDYSPLQRALRLGLVREGDVNVALRRVLLARQGGAGSQRSSGGNKRPTHHPARVCVRERAGFAWATLTPKQPSPGLACPPARSAARRTRTRRARWLPRALCC